MEAALLFFAKFVQVALEAVSLSMVIRMLLPIFFDVENNRFFGLLTVFTEIFVAPVRALLVRFNIGQNSPVDWGFFATYLIIWIIQLFLPAI